jgi:hypothetical protein
MPERPQTVTFANDRCRDRVDDALNWLLPPLLGGLIVGFAVGHWWSLLTALLIPVAFIPAGADSDGAPHWGWALILLVPPALVGLALGIAARKLARSK